MGFFPPLRRNNIRLSAAYVAIVMAMIPLFNLKVAGRGLFLYLGLVLIVASPYLGPYRYITGLTARYIVFVLYDLLTFMWSPRGISIDPVQYLKMILFVLILIMSSYSINEISFILLGQLIMGGIVAVVLSTSRTTLLSQGEFLTDTGRSILLIGDVQLDPNYTCMVMIPLAVFLCKSLLSQKNLLIRIVISLLLGMIIFGCLRTGSRGGLLAILIACAFYYIIKRDVMARKLIIALVGISVLVVLSPIIIKYLPATVARRFTFASLLRSGGSGRKEMWMKCIYHMFDNTFALLFGHGKGGTLQLLGMNSHNIMIDAMYNGGIAEVVLFIMMIGKLARKLRDSNNNYGLALLAGYLSMAMTVSVGANMFFWTGMSLINILTQINEVNFFSNTNN